MNYANANSPGSYRPGDRPRQRPPLNLNGLRFHPMPEIDESTAKFLAFLEQAQKRMVDQAAELAAFISGLLRDMPPLSSYSNASSTSAPAQPITAVRPRR